MKAFVRRGAHSPLIDSIGFGQFVYWFFLMIMWTFGFYRQSQLWVCCFISLRGLQLLPVATVDHQICSDDLQMLFGKPFYKEVYDLYFKCTWGHNGKQKGLIWYSIALLRFIVLHLVDFLPPLWVVYTAWIDADYRVTIWHHECNLCIYWHMVNHP